MGRVAEVLGIEDDGDVKCDFGGDDTFIADFYADGGDDAPPLPGDMAAVDDGPEAGTQQITGFSDSKNASQALPGEKRTYARDVDGTIVAEIHAKRNGDIKITSLKTGGIIDLNGLLIDQNGNLTTPGEVTAKTGTAAVSLSIHKHPTGVGPTGPPIPDP